MKLSEPRIAKVLTQLNAKVVPENHPAESQLSEVFGDHTFFIDAGGLNVIEPAESDGEATATGQVVKLASWFDESHTNLVAQEPEYTDLVIELDRAA